MEYASTEYAIVPVATVANPITRRRRSRAPHEGQRGRTAVLLLILNEKLAAQRPSQTPSRWPHLERSTRRHLSSQTSTRALARFVTDCWGALRWWPHVHARRGREQGRPACSTPAGVAACPLAVLFTHEVASAGRTPGAWRSFRSRPGDGSARCRRRTPRPARQRQRIGPVRADRWTKPPDQAPEPWHWTNGPGGPPGVDQRAGPTMACAKAPWTTFPPCLDQTQVHAACRGNQQVNPYAAQIGASACATDPTSLDPTRRSWSSLVHDPGPGRGPERTVGPSAGPRPWSIARGPWRACQAGRGPR